MKQTKLIICTLIISAFVLLGLTSCESNSDAPDQSKITGNWEAQKPALKALDNLAERNYPTHINLMTNGQMNIMFNMTLNLSTFIFEADYLGNYSYHDGVLKLFTHYKDNAFKDSGVTVDVAYIYAVDLQDGDTMILTYKGSENIKVGVGNLVQVDVEKGIDALMAFTPITYKRVQ